MFVPDPDALALDDAEMVRQAGSDPDRDSPFATDASTSAREGSRCGA
jgi:hypothetical protein